MFAVSIPETIREESEVEDVEIIVAAERWRRVGAKVERVKGIEPSS